MKYQRLVMGLVILISFFLFTGSWESDVCYKCNPSLLGKITITNYTSFQLIDVIVAGPDELKFSMFHNGHESLRLKPGPYLITALPGPNYDKIIFTKVIILKASDDIRIYIQ